MNMNDPQALYNRATETGPVLHLRFQGRSRDIALDALNLDNAATDDAIRMAVAQFMDVGLDQLNGTVIERHANGNLTLRPEALFG